MTQMHVHAFRNSVNWFQPSHACGGWPAPRTTVLLLAAVMLMTAARRRHPAPRCRGGPLQSILSRFGAGGASSRSSSSSPRASRSPSATRRAAFCKLIQIVFGLSIAFAASSFFLSFFSFSGGAVVSGPDSFAAGFEVPLHRSLDRSRS